MNGIIIVAVLNLLCKFAYSSAIVSQFKTPEKAFSNDFVNYQTIHKVLQSIEHRIQNLESTISVQYATSVEGKMEYYGRKIENIEKDVTRFEAYVRIEMDKLLENISNKNYKEEITKDHTIRKIDGIYERINHKLSSIEGQFDVTNIKSQNAQETILSKINKIEENLSIRNGDLEAEIADAVAAIDDLKTTCSSMEENLMNLTRDSLKAIFKNGEKSSKRQFSQTLNIFEDVSKNISVDVIQLQRVINSTMNETIGTYSKIYRAKAELEESMNEYANKITDMYSDLWKKTDMVDNTIKNLAVITNLTRNEQQNSLRALMVQVGRKTPKNDETILDNQKLTELIKKVDSNFQNVMTAQNLFLESCHRVQMDEAQLESRISIVLDKLIDTFENKTVVGPKDIKHIEHLIRNHDSNIRKSIYHITSHLLNLIQKNSDNKDEIVDYVKSQLSHLQALQMMIQDVLNTENHDQDNIILNKLQILQQAINKTQASMEYSNTMNFYISKTVNSSESQKSMYDIKIDEVFEYMKHTSNIIYAIESNINKSLFHMFLNKYNIEFVAQQFEKRLKDDIQRIIKYSNVSTIEETNMTNLLWESVNITQMLVEIFNVELYNNTYDFEKTNMLKGRSSSSSSEVNKRLCNCRACSHTHKSDDDNFKEINGININQQIESYKPSSIINGNKSKNSTTNFIKTPTDQDQDTTTTSNIQQPNYTITGINSLLNATDLLNGSVKMLNDSLKSKTVYSITSNQEQKPQNDSHTDSTLYDTKSSNFIDNTSLNLLLEDNTNGNISFDLSLDYNSNLNHSGFLLTENTSTSPREIEQLFQTTEETTYQQTEGQVWITSGNGIEEVTVGEPTLVNEKGPNLFDED